jgi:membrane protein required for colicin V production
MWIDLIYLILVISAIARGLKRGLIMTLFSFLGLLIGLAAALKLSVYVAAYLQNHTPITGKWLPVISFIIVFAIVVVLVKWIGKMIETAFEFAMLGWINRLGGALLSAGISTLVFSVLLFYADRMHLISQKAETSSITYKMIAPLGPSVIEGLGQVIPFFKNMFRDLEIFFDNFSHDLPRETVQVF